MNPYLKISSILGPSAAMQLTAKIQDLIAFSQSQNIYVYEITASMTDPALQQPYSSLDGSLLGASFMRPYLLLILKERSHKGQHRTSSWSLDVQIPAGIDWLELSANVTALADIQIHPDHYTDT